MNEDGRMEREGDGMSENANKTGKGTPPDDTTSSSSTNFLILSDYSGKPIFARHGSDEQVSQICGLLQGLRSSVLYDDSELQLGDIQSIETDTMHVVFWQIKGLTLVAIAAAAADTTMTQPAGTEAYLRLVLETLYCQLAFSLTEPVLDSLQYSSFDLNSVMGSTERQLYALLNHMEAQQQQCCGPHAVHFGGIHSLYPLPSSLRNNVSHALREVGDATPDTLFAFMFVPGGTTTRSTHLTLSPRPGGPASDGSCVPNHASSTTTVTRLVAFVQSSARSLQMQPGDLNLLLNFITHQPELRTTSELWLPVCLPRFNASGYLYCYTHCLDPDHTGLTVALMSHIGTTQQFQSFQHAVGVLRQKLSISTQSEKSLRTNDPKPIPHDVPIEATNNAKNGAPSLEDDRASDQDYVDASGDGDRMIPYVAARGLLEEVTLALDEPVLNKIHQEYLDVCQAIHFSFRYDVMTWSSSRSRVPKGQLSTGKLPQILTVSDKNHFDTTDSRRKLWSIYDKLMMRLRLGSVQTESIQDAVHMMSKNRTPAQASFPQAFCPASGLLEAAPNFSGLTSISDNDFLYVGINGESFELYFTAARRDVNVKQAAALGTALVRRLLLDKQSIFVWNPMVWKKKK